MFIITYNRNNIPWIYHQHKADRFMSQPYLISVKISSDDSIVCHCGQKVPIFIIETFKKKIDIDLKNYYMKTAFKVSPFE